MPKGQTDCQTPGGGYSYWLVLKPKKAIMCVLVTHEMLSTPSTALGPDGQNRSVCRFVGSIGGEILLGVHTQTISSLGPLVGHPRFKASHLFLFCWSFSFDQFSCVAVVTAVVLPSLWCDEAVLGLHDGKFYVSNDDDSQRSRLTRSKAKHNQSGCTRNSQIGPSWKAKEGIGE